MSWGELKVVSGPLVGRQIVVDEEIVFGREGEGVGRLGDDQELSRRHARIARDAQGNVVVEDLGSTNGTFVDGRRLSGEHALRPGEEIRLGSSSLRWTPSPETVESATPQAAGEGSPTVIGTVREGRSRRAADTERAPVVEPVARAAQPASAAPVPAAVHVPPLPPLPPNLPHAELGGSARRRSVPLVPAVFVLLLLVAAAVVAVALERRNSPPKPKPINPAALIGRPSPIAQTCGRGIGAHGPVADIAYVESNALHGRNSIIAIPYSQGSMTAQPMSQCPTHGSGSADLTDSGVLDADQEVIVNASRTLLFAVNQGSDTIAVFHIAPNGALRPVSGSPFPSGGRAPVSLGLSGNTLVVANKAQDGIRALSGVAPDYTSFTVTSTGSLTHINGSTVYAQPGSSPTDAYVPPTGSVAFGTEESGPIRAFSVAADGALSQSPGSPYQPPKQLFDPGFDPAKRFALGIVGYPGRRLLYVSLATIPAIVVYSYTAQGSLTPVNAVSMEGAYLPCWLAVTPNGRWLYTSNADTDNVTVFDISNPLEPKQIQTLPFQTAGNPWQEHIDPTGHFLFVNTPRDTYKTPPGEGNTQHVMSIAGDGVLTELHPRHPTAIPVPEGTNPQGLAIIPGPAR